MSNLKVQASPTGTGVVTLVPPTTNTDRTVTLPDQTGTVYITGGDIGTPSAAVLTNATGLPLSTGVTGTLAVANGGTGVTTSTGTGSVVLSNSPTLVTPALGTPSSGNGSNLTNLNASNLSSGTVPDARFPATLPAASGANLTNLNASNLATGTVATARLGSGTANSTTFLRGDGTWASAGGVPAFDDIGSVAMFWHTGTSNVSAGSNVSGSNLFRVTSAPAADSAYDPNSPGVNLNLTSYPSLSGNYAGRTSALTANSRTFSPVSGTWRVQSFTYRSIYVPCFNATYWGATIAVRVA